jgi:hypothetical protein
VARLAGAFDSRRPCLEGDESVPLAGRLMLADAIERWRIDRPNRAPLMRFCPLQRSLVALRYPGQPATGRSRFGVWTQSLGRALLFCSLATALVVALAVFRLASIQTVVFGCLPRWQVMRRRIFVAAIGDVPLPAIGSRGLIGVGQEGACPEARWRSWGFCPSQCCSCCRVACAAFPRAGPTCHSPERRPRYFSSRDRPPCPHTRSHPPTLHPTRDSIVGRHTGRPQSSGTVDQGRSGRLLGFGPGSSPRPPPLSRRSRWNAGSGGPILPWAFGLSQAFGSSHGADNSASTVTLTPADARDVPQAVGPRTLLEQSYPLIEIRT